MSEYINIALPKGRLGEKVYSLFESIGYGCPDLLDGGRKLIFENQENKVRYFWAKPSDVAIYVERGAADIGVVGKDILLEYSPDVYELCDLGFGKCKMCVCGHEDFREALTEGDMIRIATKYPKIARSYFNDVRHQSVDIIKLNGSIELAPIVGLSDVIVDIVETGSTLRENGLSILEEIFDISARMVVNPVSMRLQSKRINELIGKIKEVL